MKKYDLSPDVLAFKASLAAQRISQIDFCESHNLNLGYFRLAMCGKIPLTGANAAAVREFMASFRFIQTGSSEEAGHE